MKHLITPLFFAVLACFFSGCPTQPGTHLQVTGGAICLIKGSGSTCTSGEYAFTHLYGSGGSAGLRIRVEDAGTEVYPQYIEKVTLADGNYEVKIAGDSLELHTGPSVLKSSVTQGFILHKKTNGIIAVLGAKPNSYPEVKITLNDDGILLGGVTYPGAVLSAESFESHLQLVTYREYKGGSEPGASYKAAGSGGTIMVIVDNFTPEIDPTIRNPECCSGYDASMNPAPAPVAGAVDELSWNLLYSAYRNNVCLSIRENFLVVRYCTSRTEQLLDISACKILLRLEPSGFLYIYRESGCALPDPFTPPSV